MQINTRIVLLVLLLSVVLLPESGCKKSDSPTAPEMSVALYQVTATVVDTSGRPQPGALIVLENPPAQAGQFIATTDSTGKGTIQAPAGQQTLSAHFGLTLRGSTTVTVQQSSTPTNAGVIHLQQSVSSAKVLVVYAQAESLETVLRAGGVTSFDTTYLDTLRNFANKDSSGLLTYLRRYDVVFSDCAGGLEIGSNYAILSRTYGRYIDNGGTMVGGHCNFYHLRRIWPSYYMNEDYQVNEPLDSLRILDQSLASWLGASVLSWASSASPARLSGYDKFSDLPTSATIYGTISWTNPQIGVIVGNPRGKGRFIWTNYHNQDVASDGNLIRIVQYFLVAGSEPGLMADRTQ